MPRRRNPLFPESHLHVLDVNSAAAVILEGPHGLAAYGVGPLQHAGLSLSAIFGGTAIVAAVLAVLSSAVSPSGTGPPGTPSPVPPHPQRRRGDHP